MGRKIFLFSVIVILGLEIYLRLLGNPGSFREEESAQFRYEYLDIHKKFFKKISRSNKTYYVPQRFPNNAREFFISKPSDTIRIFILGGSFALDYGFLSQEELFQKLAPAKKFELINCGMGAYDSYRVLLLAKEILSYSPDLLIVFSGNNEFYSRLKINLVSYYLDRMLSRSHLYSKIKSLFIPWYLKRISASEDKEKKYRIYQRNIRRLVRLAKSKGVPVILATLPINLKWPPAGSLPSKRTFLEAELSLERENFSQAIEKLNLFLEENPESPYGFYYLGYAYENAGNSYQAEKSYSQAIELSFWDRASHRSNQILRQIAQEEDLGLIDLERAFQKLVQLQGGYEEVFFDRCHIYPQYYHLVTALILAELLSHSYRYAGILPSLQEMENFKIGFSQPGLKENVRSEDGDKLERLVQTAIWEILKLVKFSSQNGLSERAIYSLNLIHKISPSQIDEMISKKTELVKKVISNSWAHFSFNQIEIAHSWPLLLNHVGEVYRRKGLYQKALQSFEQSIKLNPNNYFPYLGKALIYYRRGKIAQARSNLEIAKSLALDSRTAVLLANYMRIFEK